MKWSAATVTAATLLTTASLFSSFESVDAFSPLVSVPRSSTRSSFAFGVSSLSSSPSIQSRRQHSLISLTMSSSSSSAGLSVGIVGATGAVGQEILSVLEKRSTHLNINQVHLFSSARSAGKKVDSSVYGTLTLEEFTRDKARQCDVVFLAVSGDFALEHAKALTEGVDGCVCIDNSVCKRIDLYICNDMTIINSAILVLLYNCSTLL
jgi:hypothetical protein